MPGLFDGFEGYRILTEVDVDRALNCALVAIDANVLLNLYRYNAQTTDDLLAIFEKFGDRLVVPHQAMREFHRNRLAAIGNPDSAASDVRSALQKNQRSTNDALGRWAKQVALAEAELQQLQADVGKLYESLQTAVGQAEPDQVHANTPAARDRVLSRLSVLLDGKVLPRPPDDEWNAMIAEGKKRVEEHQPPGYLDADKGDEHPEGPAGDYLVYWQACEEATKRQLDLVIITGDEKDDWWWRHRSVVVGPRQEMTKEFFDLSNGRQLFLLRPRDLLEQSSALNVQVSPASVEDAKRPRDDLAPEGQWAPEAVTELLARLDSEGQVQAEVIREAAARGGTISREAVYEICGYDDERMLRGFTRPTNRITADLQRAGILSEPVTPILKPLYPDGVRASGFRIPGEVVAILRAAEGLDDAETDPGGSSSEQSVSKYWPLTQWLRTQPDDVIPMTFADLEEMLGLPLPQSARSHLPYWYSVRNSLGKALALGGFKARRVNFVSETVELVRR
ncbi:PIN-like domain-containing protein [Dactylosporangium fulvum]|uniref:PIN-like domain-containing protein n=1 Tax=Dactylosporangium fulvum TaxID=53359 RepID=A0ABY5W1G2_9ACTN|nr:PIN-like domain-containing protein [Dactylosporangium fulvum]UWP83196.1 PIN-like domain-containing protein [Dactylosporangium fulvum]